ncbi:MAG: hypothetical protein NTY07_00350 [Bacteroidia bacterium]|nr:hypothetical protein [Bacteroidia bacterium]
MTVKQVLYRLPNNATQEQNKWPLTFLGYQVSLLSPGLLSLGKYGRNPIINLLWYLATYGKFKILYLLDGKTVVHYSYITPKSFRFPFMEKDDFMIGPCFTNISYRGKGIFTEVLRLINSVYNDKELWTYTTLTNITSQKVFERTGYKFYSFVKMSRLSKIVRLIK